MKRGRLMWLGLAVALAAGPVSGRVFRLRPGAHGGAEVGQPGWALAYRADLRINDGAGRLEVIGVDRAPTETMAQLRSAYEAMGLSVWLQGMGDMAFGFAVGPDRVIRLLLFSRPPGRACLVFRMDQTREAFFASIEPPRAHRLETISPPPGGAPTLFMADDQAGMAVEISNSVQSAAALSRFYAEDLRRAGWTPLPPGPQGAGVAPSVLYARDDLLALVQIAEARAADRRVVVRLVKRQRAASDIAAPRPLR